MLFVFVLDHRSDVKQLLNGSILDLLIRVVEQLIHQAEDLSCSNHLLLLRALLLDKLDEWNELIQQGQLNLMVLLCQVLQRHDQPLHQESFLNVIGEVHQALSEVKLVVLVEVLDLLLDHVRGS